MSQAASVLILSSDLLSAKLYRAVLKEAGLRSVVAPDSAVMDGALRESAVMDGALRESAVMDGPPGENAVMDGALGENMPALIIVDPVRWNASLIDKLRGLRARPEFRGARLLALINHGIGPERAEALAPICDGILTKPISVAGFLETVGRLVPDPPA